MVGGSGGPWCHSRRRPRRRLSTSRGCGSRRPGLASRAPGASSVMRGHGGGREPRRCSWESVSRCPTRPFTSSTRTWHCSGLWASRPWATREFPLPVTPGAEENVARRLGRDGRASRGSEPGRGLGVQALARRGVWCSRPRLARPWRADPRHVGTRGGNARRPGGGGVGGDRAEVLSDDTHRARRAVPARGPRRGGGYRPAAPRLCGGNTGRGPVRPHGPGEERSLPARRTRSCAASRPVRRATAASARCTSRS